MPPPLPTLGLAVSFLTCSYLIYNAFTPPNPPPTNPWTKDTLVSHRHSDTLLKAGAPSITFLWLYHTTLILFPPQHRSLLCPHPEHLASELFMWDRYTAVCIVLILIAAPVRLLAYRQLGSSFTFELAKPRGLVKTGLYAYCQHPSYSTLFVLMVATYALLLRFGGVVGCWMPSWLAEWKALDIAGVVLFGVLAFVMLRVRVRDEEEMMRASFGSEWVVYAKNTKRFVPGLF